MANTIAVFIPMTWTRRGGRKMIIAPDGGDAWAPAKPRPDETLVRALARAHRLKRLIEGDSYQSVGEVAEVENVTCSCVSQLLRFSVTATGSKTRRLVTLSQKKHHSMRQSRP